MAPKFLTGDMVNWGTRPGHGIVIGVNRANHDERMAELYPWVYYIFFLDQKRGARMEGPLYQGELVSA